MEKTPTFCKGDRGAVLSLGMRNKPDTSEFDTRVRRALLEENNGLRQWRRSRLEWRALQALMAAAAPATAA